MSPALFKKRAMLSGMDGFNLVEMAIVMVIFGFLFVTAIKVTGPMLDRLKQNATTKTIGSATEALIGFAGINRRLPTDVEFSAVMTDSDDVWGNDLIYMTDSDLTGSGNICERSSTSIAVQVCDTALCATPVDTIENIAFIVLSSGANLNLQTDTTTSPVKVYQQEILGIDDYTTGLNRPEEYRDIYKWMTLSELRLKVGCEEAPLNILDISLSSGLNATPYISNVYATGGITFSDIDGDTDTADDYEWCVAAGAPGGLSYQCNPDDGSLASSAVCGLASGTWQQCSSLEISGTPTSSGTFRIPVYVRDDSGNITSRIFVVTISSISGLNICPEYRVWNDKAAVDTDYRITLAGVPGVCDDILLNDEITSSIGTLTPNEVMERHSTSNASCGGLEANITYNEAIAADTDGDCCLWFTEVDRTCP